MTDDSEAKMVARKDAKALSKKIKESSTHRRNGVIGTHRF